MSKTEQTRNAAVRDRAPLVVTKKLRQTGNSWSLNLDKAIRDASGFYRDQELRIEAVDGRVVITAAGDDDYRDAIAAYEESAVRYRAVYDALAE
ncbi:MAG: hypothetical protein Tsb0010_13490 [Parvularculaceae bacterium]